MATLLPSSEIEPALKPVLLGIEFAAGDTVVVTPEARFFTCTLPSLACSRTKRPSGVICTQPPPLPLLTRCTAPVRRFFTNASSALLVSPATRLVELELKAIRLPSAEMPQGSRWRPDPQRWMTRAPAHRRRCCQQAVRAEEVVAAEEAEEAEEAGAGRTALLKPVVGRGLQALRAVIGHRVASTTATSHQAHQGRQGQHGLGACGLSRVLNVHRESPHPRQQRLAALRLLRARESSRKDQGTAKGLSRSGWRR